MPIIFEDERISQQNLNPWLLTLADRIERMDLTDSNEVFNAISDAVLAVYSAGMVVYDQASTSSESERWSAVANFTRQALWNQSIGGYSEANERNDVVARIRLNAEPTETIGQLWAAAAALTGLCATKVAEREFGRLIDLPAVPKLRVERRAKRAIKEYLRAKRYYVV